MTISHDKKDFYMFPWDDQTITIDPFIITMVTEIGTEFYLTIKKEDGSEEHWGVPEPFLKFMSIIQLTGARRAQLNMRIAMGSELEISDLEFMTMIREDLVEPQPEDEEIENDNIV